MKVMIDTNVFISAILKADSLPSKVLDYSSEYHELVLCDYIIDECYDVANRRFPSKIGVLDALFIKLSYELVPVPRIGRVEIRDVKDQPILNAAIEHEIDVLVTGDKHFLELASTIEKPMILTPSQFCQQYDITGA